MNPFVLIGAAAAVLFGGWWAMRERDIDILARTAWGEARGSGATGMQAVLNVIVNRHKSAAWYRAETLAGTALKAYQFSVWLPGDPNYAKVTNVTENDAVFRTALGLAKAAVDGTLPDITGGATHYYAKSISPPAWAVGAVRTADIGGHLFFKGVA